MLEAIRYLMEKDNDNGVILWTIVDSLKSYEKGRRCPAAEQNFSTKK